MFTKREFLWLGISALCFLLFSCEDHGTHGFYEKGKPIYTVKYIKLNNYPKKIDTLTSEVVLKGCDSLLCIKTVYFEEHIYKRLSKKDSIVIDSSVFYVDAIGCQDNKWRLRFNKRLQLMFYEQLPPPASK